MTKNKNNNSKEKVVKQEYKNKMPIMKEVKVNINKGSMRMCIPNSLHTTMGIENGDKIQYEKVEYNDDKTKLRITLTVGKNNK